MFLTVVVHAELAPGSTVAILALLFYMRVEFAAKHKFALAHFLGRGLRHVELFHSLTIVYLSLCQVLLLPLDNRLRTLVP